MRLVQSYRVKDSTGSEILLYEYRASEVRKLLGLVPLRLPVTRYRLDTGEEVERRAECGSFRVKQSGEELVLVD